MLSIIKAKENDVKDICSIGEKLLRENVASNSGGFLIRPLEEDVVREQIHEFLVAISTETNKIVGYIWINNAYPQERLTSTNFTQEFNLEKSIYIKQVAVDPDQSRKGIASKIYEFTINYFSKNNILACVAVEPIENTASIRFHEKFNFLTVGTLALNDYLGFDRYVADVFLLEQSQ